MREYSAAFAGHHVLIRYDNEAAGPFLALLFGGLQGARPNDPESVLELLTSAGGANRDLSLIDNGEFCAAATLGTALAAVLFDRVIFHLLRSNDSGVALHAGAVARNQRVLLIPGQSGAGKSTLTAWLTSRGFAYLSDELVFLPAAEPLRPRYFSRPLHIKPGAREVVRSMLSAGHCAEVFEDDHGMLIPPQAINPGGCDARLPPSVLLFPAYRPGAGLLLEKISPAKAGACLMACDVNGRNLADHGFGQIMAVARSVPAYRLIYSGFAGLEEAIAPLLTATNR